jgi:L-alanine-DL-glutamate epimerase-like enolase superfamily enzyme
VHITDVRAVLLTGPSSNDPWITVAKARRSAAFVEILTDVGLVGVGETYAGYFAPELVPPIVDYVRPILVNAETTDVALLSTRMRRCLAFWARVGVGAAVLSGVEAALWDLAGKLAGVPVHELLGGARHDRLRAYATGGPSLRPDDAFRAKMDRYAELGFTAIKVASGYVDLNGGGDRNVTRDHAAEVEADKLATMRAHLGPDFGIMLDGHMGHRNGLQRWDLETACQVMSAVEPYGLIFFEEPLAYEDPDEYAELTAASPVPIAGGEQLTTAQEFRTWMSRGAFAVAQPDAAWTGIADFVAVGALAEQSGAAVASHCWSAGGGVLQNMHAAFACRTTIMVELMPDAGELHTRLWGDSLAVEDGYVLPPQGPGLGVTLSEDTKDRFPFVPGAEEFSSVPGKILAS